MTTYKVSDGWREVRPLREFLVAYDGIYDYIYELKNCVRTMTLIEMRDALKEQVEAMNQAIEGIGDDDKVVEIKEED